MNAVSIHDSHNIEIKNTMELLSAKCTATLDLYVFIPKGFSGTTLQKIDLLDDIRSKMKFSFCDQDIGGSYNLLLAIDSVTCLLENNLPTQDKHHHSQLTLEVRKLSNIIQEQFKKTLKHKKTEELQLISDLIDKTRQSFSSEPLEIMQLFDEFTSQTYVQFLLSIESHFPDSSEIKQLKIKEANYRKEKKYLIDENSCSLDLEKKLTHMGLMKKYFQSHSFVEIKKNKFSLPLQILSIFKKDFPSLKSQLDHHGKSFGMVEEWIHITPSHTVDESILNKRYSYSSYKLESKIPEDVIHYKRKIKVTGFPNSEVQNKPFKALNDTLRLNIERYLKLMDDPIKDFYDISSEGYSRKFQTNKVYHFYIIVNQKQGSQSQSNIFKAILNKSGILKIENPQME